VCDIRGGPNRINFIGTYKPRANGKREKQERRKLIISENRRREIDPYKTNGSLIFTGRKCGKEEVRNPREGRKLKELHELNTRVTFSKKNQRGGGEKLG